MCIYFFFFTEINKKSKINFKVVKKILKNLNTIRIIETRLIKPTMLAFFYSFFISFLFINRFSFSFILIVKGVLSIIFVSSEFARIIKLGSSLIR